ncbi:LOW QUALITY PROTEIN: hypothetical protein ACHAXN_000301, partial [Cyclotella atomus]
MWRYKFTTEQQQAFTLNAKEFLAAAISQQLALQDDKSPLPCDENKIADSLSRDTHLTDEQLLKLWQTTSPPLLPENPQILPLSNYFMDRLASTIDAQDKGVTLDTHSKYARSWRISNKFLKKIPTNNKYLDGFTQNERNTTLCVFMDTVKNGEFNKQSKSVRGTTVQKDADNVAKIIKASGWPDPRLTESGKQSLQYKRQTSNYKSRDGASKHQKALPPEVYRWWICQATHNREKARANLLAGALFFGMRSCEYSKTPKSETQKTLPIRPCDIVFRIGNEVIDHNDNRITIADSIEITFVLQKNGEELCPVKHWSYNIQRLCSYPNYDPTWPVYYYFDANTNKTSHISSHEIIIDIRASVDAIGEKILGFTSKDVGTHSNCEAFAMMHYLAGTP